MLQFDGIPNVIDTLWLPNGNLLILSLSSLPIGDISTERDVTLTEWCFQTGAVEFRWRGVVWVPSLERGAEQLMEVDNSGRRLFIKFCQPLLLQDFTIECQFEHLLCETASASLSPSGDTVQFFVVEVGHSLWVSVPVHRIYEESLSGLHEDKLQVLQSWSTDGVRAPIINVISGGVRNLIFFKPPNDKALRVVQTERLPDLHDPKVAGVRKINLENVVQFQSEFGEISRYWTTQARTFFVLKIGGYFELDISATPTLNELIEIANPQSIQDICIHPTNRFLCWCFKTETTIQIFDRFSRAIIREFQFGDSQPLQLKWSMDGTTISVLLKDNKIIVWDVDF